MEVREVLKNLGFEEQLVAELLSVGYKKHFVAGSEVIGPENQKGEVPFVLNGLLKVLRREGEAKELLLYYLEAGETCAMSINCCLEGKSVDLSVIAEQDTEIWFIPLTYLDMWVQKYKSFRKFVFSSYQTRLDELLLTVDSISFMKMDERLLKYLLDQKQASGHYIIEKSHQQIANDLNTSRVVISRLLKQLERQDKIQQSRSRIEIL